jgi:hypothetical protein
MCREEQEGDSMLVSQETAGVAIAVERGEHPRLRWGQEKGENDDRTLASDYLPTT